MKVNVKLEKQVYALVDCNNFFVSCERVFQPKLQSTPVAVLSNNDGCFISRSQEVKAMGIPMGAPYFKYKPLVEKNRVKVLSANFTLYTDISQRVMQTLNSLCENVQVYSIDEAFLLLSGVRKRDNSYTQFGREIRDRVLRWTGIPVSVGVAPTKTLAKAANEVAKKYPIYEGVLDLTSIGGKEVDEILEELELEEVWGIGRRYAAKLRNQGISNAKELKYTDPDWMRKKTNIMGYRTVLELNSQPCFGLQIGHDQRKSIICTRSFGRRITEFQELERVLTSYTSQACERLRRQGSVAQSIYLFIHTDPHNKYQRYYYNGLNIRLPAPTFDTVKFVKAVREGLKKIYLPQQRYKKAGVYLTEISQVDSMQLHMFEHGGIKELLRKEELLKAVDRVNTLWGRDTVKLVVEGIRKEWSMKRAWLSPRYTTNWNELPSVI